MWPRRSNLLQRLCTRGIRRGLPRVLGLGQQVQDAGVAVGGDAESRPCDAHSENDHANLRNVDEFQPGPLRPAPIPSTINCDSFGPRKPGASITSGCKRLHIRRPHCHGRYGKTFMWLDASYKEGDPDLIELNSEPEFDGIRADPRFGKLMQRVG